MNTFVKVVGQVSLSAISIVLNGWAFSILWGWFIVTTFGMNTLSIPAAIGLGFVVSYITKQYQKKDACDEAIWYDLKLSLLKPFVALGAGWIVKGFM